MCSGGSDWTCLQPGFPIRKSSDHSLVIDSPRLIADSYVLLRFLVPRHPPCALINLSHKDLRCSRPLCSSQHTGGPPPVPTPTSQPASGSSRWRSRPKRPKETDSRNRPSPQDPTTCQAPPHSRRRSTPPQTQEQYLPTGPVTVPTNRCSTLEHLPTDTRSGPGSGSHDATSAP